jgi:hypothetical protein
MMHPKFAAALVNDIDSAKDSVPVTCWDRTRIHPGFGADAQRGREAMDAYGWTEYCAFHFRDEVGNWARLDVRDGSMVVVLAAA